MINGCNPSCISADCGDGALDPDGVDNILGNVDDEECDDGNVINGDGCSSLCDVEYCGDNYEDLDGPDNVSGTNDDENCDIGINNGVF